jgi:hypothetical protein
MVTDKADAGVKYLQNRYELAALPGNFVKLTNLFLGTKLKDFEELSKLLGINNDIKIGLIRNESFIGNMSWKVWNSLTIPIYAMFSEGHGEFFIEPRKIFLEQPFSELISGARINHDQAHLSYMCQSENVDLQKRIALSKSAQNSNALNVLVYGVNLTNETGITGIMSILLEISQLHFFRGLHKSFPRLRMGEGNIFKRANLLFGLMPNQIQEVVGHLDINFSKKDRNNLLLTSIISSRDAPSTVLLFLNRGLVSISEFFIPLTTFRGHKIFFGLLQMASYLGHTEIVKVLLDKGFFVDTYSVSYATISHHFEVLDILLSKVAEIEKLKEQCGNLFAAALTYDGLTRPSLSNLLKVFEVLFKYGFDLNEEEIGLGGFAGTQGGPLYCAVKTQGYEIVNYLIKHGASINAKNDQFDPLQEAIKEKNIGAIRAFVENEIRDGQENNMLHLAVKFSDDINLIKEIMAMKKELANETNKSSQTPADVAKSYGKLEIVKLLSPS